MIGNPRIRKHNVHLTIGNVVSALVTTVTQHFSYIRINVKDLANELMFALRFIRKQIDLIILKYLNGSKQEAYLRKLSKT